LVFKRLCRVFSDERPIYSIIFCLSKIYQVMKGKLRAFILGWPNSFVGYGAQISGTQYIKTGSNIYINQFSRIQAISKYRDQEFKPLIMLGDNFSASDSLFISGIHKIIIGDNCMLGSNVYISDCNHGSYKGEGQSAASLPPKDRNLVSFGAVKIGSNVWIGNNVNVIGPVVIGDGAVIGANAIIVKDVAANTMVVGRKMKVIKKFNSNLHVWETIKKDG